MINLRLDILKSHQIDVAKEPSFVSVQALINVILMNKDLEEKSKNNMPGMQEIKYEG